MIGALVFLGCPWRAILRLAGGDINAVVGLAGLTVGIAIGDQCLKHSYNLGRSYKTKTYFSAGLIMPAMVGGVLALLVFSYRFSLNGAIFFSEKGPGSLHAPLIISLLAGLIIGFIAQRTRFCTMGSIRDVILVGDLHLMRGVIALAISAFAHNFDLAAKPDKILNGSVYVGGVSSAGMTAVIIGLIVCLIIGFTMREKI